MWNLQKAYTRTSKQTDSLAEAFPEHTSTVLWHAFRIR